jgi:hypothetical protein
MTEIGIAGAGRVVSADNGTDRIVIAMRGGSASLAKGRIL